jgi:hypothetical protein
MKDRSQLQGGNNSSNEDSNSLSSNDRNSDLVQELFGFRGQGDDLGTMSPVVPEVNLSSGSEDSDVEVHPRNIPAKFGSNRPSGFREEA